MIGDDKLFAPLPNKRTVNMRKCKSTPGWRANMKKNFELMNEGRRLRWAKYKAKRKASNAAR